MIGSSPQDECVAATERLLPSMAQRELYQGELSYLLARIKGAQVSVLATVDGRVVMHASHGKREPADTAAIVRSLCTLGESLARESNWRDGRNALMETSAGHSAAQCLPAPIDRLILLTACTRETNLGALLTYNRLCAEAIARIATSPTG